MAASQCTSQEKCRLHKSHLRNRQPHGRDKTNIASAELPVGVGMVAQQALIAFHSGEALTMNEERAI